MATSTTTSEEPAAKPRISDDWLAVLCGVVVLSLAFAAVWVSSDFSDAGGEPAVTAANPLKPWISKPAGWMSNASEAFYKTGDDGSKDFGATRGILGVFLCLSILLTLAVGLRDGASRLGGFVVGFAGVFVLATLAYVMSAQSLVKAYNLEYALWALLVGLVISNTIGTPRWLVPAVQTEFYIKTGLVLLGAGVLLSRLVILGIPGIVVAWVVTPIVLISTYIFGQRVLKMESKSLNMVVAADMSVCGVSAAIASAAACKAKKEELSLAIGMSLSFTVLMMIVMPIAIKLIGMNEIVGAAWMGGTIDSTGAVAAAGQAFGDQGLQVASTVKMIQNVLIGVSAFGIAVYWVSAVEKSPGTDRPRVSEIWKRFPKFVLGFIGASIVFSLVHAMLPGGPELVEAMVKGTTKTLRGWLFCLAFVCIGLETKFSEMFKYMRGGKPLVLYLCGQTLNLVLTLVMAWLMFEVVFGESIAELFPADQ
ncbi:MAG: putative sulfate exporter family transporter [Aureliella sp.]